MERLLSGFRYLAGTVVAVLLLTLPWLVSPYSLSRMGPVFYLTVAILSLTIAQGLVGQFSIGQGAFMGLGAYVSGVLVATYAWSYIAAGLTAVVVTGLVAALVSIPTLRLRGLHVVLITLGIGLVFPALIQRFSAITGGTAGFPVFTPLPLPVIGGLRSDVVRYFLLLSLALACMILVYNLKNSRIGRALVAIRDHQLVAESFGVRVLQMKVISFGLSGAVAGLAGVMFTIDRQFLSPADFSLSRSIDLFIGLAVAGPVSVAGAVLGAAFLEFTPGLIEGIGADPRLTPFIFGVVLLLITYFLRGGIGGLLGKAVASRPRGRGRPLTTVSRTAEHHANSRSVRAAPDVVIYPRGEESR